VDPSSTVLLEKRSGTELWTFAGLHGNAALTAHWSVPVTFDNLTVRTKASAIEVEEALRCQYDLPPPLPDRKTRPKFSECLPDSVLGLYASKRRYDWSAADHIRRSRIVHVRA
jgi:hypothetical protein